VQICVSNWGAGNRAAVNPLQPLLADRRKAQISLDTTLPSAAQSTARLLAVRPATRFPFFAVSAPSEDDFCSRWRFDHEPFSPHSQSCTRIRPASVASRPGLVFPAVFRRLVEIRNRSARPEQEGANDPRHHCFWHREPGSVVHTHACNLVARRIRPQARRILGFRTLGWIHLCAYVCAVHSRGQILQAVRHQRGILDVAAH